MTERDLSHLNEIRQITKETFGAVPFLSMQEPPLSETNHARLNELLFANSLVKKIITWTITDATGERPIQRETNFSQDEENPDWRNEFFIPESLTPEQRAALQEKITKRIETISNPKGSDLVRRIIMWTIRDAEEANPDPLTPEQKTALKEKNTERIEPIETLARRIHLKLFRYSIADYQPTLHFA